MTYSIEEYAAGAAHIYNRVDGVWTGSQKVVASDRFERDNFGSAVSISGNYIAVGMRNWLYGNGAVYIFEYSSVNSNWAQAAKLLPSDMTGTEMLGYGTMVTIDGDYVAVGAHHADKDEDGNVVDNAGSVYIYERDSTTDAWSEIHILTPSDRAAGDLFGSGVSLDGDHLLVGAMFDDMAGDDSNSGSVYVFEIY